MSEKAYRYIGLAIWLSIIVIFWFFDDDDLWGRGRLEIDIGGSTASTVANIIRYSISPELSRNAAELIWLASLPVALYLAWRFRSLPARLIVKFAKVFHRNM